MADEEITLPAPESIFAEGTPLGDHYAEVQHFAKVDKEAAALLQAQTKGMGNLTTVLALLFGALRLYCTVQAALVGGGGCDIE